MASTISTTIPPDDVNNKLTVANPDDSKMRHISVGGGTYTILVTGEQTGGRYCLIDMLVPPGAGPPPHRHDFEEMFTILDGEITSGKRRLDCKHPRQRAALFQEQVEQAGTPSLHVHASGSGGIFHGGRRPGR